MLLLDFLYNTLIILHEIDKYQTIVLEIPGPARTMAGFELFLLQEHE